MLCSASSSLSSSHLGAGSEGSQGGPLAVGKKHPTIVAVASATIRHAATAAAATAAVNIVIIIVTTITTTTTTTIITIITTTTTAAAAAAPDEISREWRGLAGEEEGWLEHVQGHRDGLHFAEIRGREE